MLHDGHRLRIDLHLYEEAGPGRLHYGSAVHGQTVPAAALGGHGETASRAVRCEAPEWALRWRQGYPRAVDRHDVPLLCARYGLALPAGYSAPHRG